MTKKIGIAAAIAIAVLVSAYHIATLMGARGSEAHDLVVFVSVVTTVAAALVAAADTAAFAAAVAAAAALAATTATAVHFDGSAFFIAAASVAAVIACYVISTAAEAEEEGMAHRRWMFGMCAVEAAAIAGAIAVGHAWWSAIIALAGILAILGILRAAPPPAPAPARRTTA